MKNKVFGKIIANMALVAWGVAAIITSSDTGWAQNTKNTGDACGTYQEALEAKCKTPPLGKVVFNNTDLKSAVKRAFGPAAELSYTFKIDEKHKDLAGFKKIKVTGETKAAKARPMDDLWFNGTTFLVGGETSDEVKKTAKPATGNYGEYKGWRVIERNESILALEKNGVMVSGAIIPIIEKDAITVFTEIAAATAAAKGNGVTFPNTIKLTKYMMARVKKLPHQTSGKGQREFFIFHDPYCPHCKRIFNEMRIVTDGGLAKVHWIEVGILGERSVLAAEWINSQDSIEVLNAWNAEDHPSVSSIYRGDEMSRAEVIRSMNVFNDAKALGTPFIVIEKKDGTGLGISSYANPRDLLSFYDKVNK